MLFNNIINQLSKESYKNHGKTQIFILEKKYFVWSKRFGQFSHRFTLTVVVIIRIK